MQASSQHAGSDCVVLIFLILMHSGKDTGLSARSAWAPASVRWAGDHSSSATSTAGRSVALLFVANTILLLSIRGGERLKTRASRGFFTAFASSRAGVSDRKDRRLRPRALAAAQVNRSAEMPRHVRHHALGRRRNLFVANDEANCRLLDCEQIDDEDQRCVGGIAGVSLSSRSKRRGMISSRRPPTRMPTTPVPAFDESPTPSLNWKARPSGRRGSRRRRRPCVLVERPDVVEVSSPPLLATAPVR